EPEADGAAERLAGDAADGGDDAADTLGDARGAPAGLRPDGAGEGPARAGGHVPARPQERARAGCDDRRHPAWAPARRRGDRRADLRAAGGWVDAAARDLPAR